jgi:hypothetical protein
MSSFEYSPDQWYRKYYLGEPQKTSAEMEFGKDIGEKLATDPNFMPHIPRQKHMEYGVQVKLGNTKLVGYFDSFGDLPEDAVYPLHEYKTGKKPWDQKRADEHGQITFYCLLLWLSKKIRPEQVLATIHWMPTEEVDQSFKDFLSGTRNIEFKKGGQVASFVTKRSMKDVLLFAERINKTRKEMEEYIKKRQ